MSPTSTQEKERLKVLQSYRVLDKNIEDDLTGINDLASEICGTPISMINLLASSHQITKVSKGWNIDKISRHSSFCQYTLMQEKMLIVENAIKDVRFNDSPFVQDELGIRFYAAVPLKTSKGHVLGALCVLDSSPRKLDNSQQRSIQLLAEEVVKRLDLIKNKSQMKRRNKDLQKSKALLGNSSDIQTIIDADTLEIIDINDDALKILGGTKSDYINKSFGGRIKDVEIREEILSFLKQKKGKSECYVSAVKTLTGEKKDLEYSFNFKNDKWYLTARDITSRRKAEKNLKQTLANLHIGQELAQVGSWRFVYDKEELEWSDQAYEIYGYTKNVVPSVELFIERIHPMTGTLWKKRFSH